MGKLERLQSHFDAVVLPALRDYAAAEASLTEAWKSKDAVRLDHAAREAERLGRTAAIELHHFGDFVAKSPSVACPSFPSGRQGANEARRWAAKHCTRLRSETPSDDVNLLWAIADAFKHAELDGKVRAVETADDTRVQMLGYGEGAYGEGKFGGAAQVVVVLTAGGYRPLSTVLQNTLDAWRRALNWPVPELGDWKRTEVS